MGVLTSYLKAHAGPWDLRKGVHSLLARGHNQVLLINHALN